MITEEQRQKILKALRDSYANLTAEHTTEKEFENIIEAMEIVKNLIIPIVSTRTFAENQEVTYKGKKYFFKEYNPKNGKTLIANAKSVRYNDYNDWWVDSTYVC